MTKNTKNATRELSYEANTALFKHYTSGKTIDECQDVILGLCNGKETVVDILLTSLIDAIKEESKAETILLNEGLNMDDIYNLELQYTNPKEHKNS